MELILILGGLAVAGGVVVYFVIKSTPPAAPIATPEVVAEAKALRDRYPEPSTPGGQEVRRVL